MRVKVGISFISTEKAKANISELSSWDFDEIRNAGIAQWKEVLNTVEVEGNDNDKTIFYSALYHAFYNLPTARVRIRCGNRPNLISTIIMPSGIHSELHTRCSLF